jgi:hypothetical protein
MPHVTIGDEAFPLSKHLLRPYSADQVSDEETNIFNYRLSRKLNVSENCFGISVWKFRIFKRKKSYVTRHMSILLFSRAAVYIII